MEDYTSRLFIENLMKMNDSDYVKALILYHTAPVLSGYRPGVLLSFVNNKRKIYDTWKTCGCKFICNTGIEYYELNETANSTAVLFYNRTNLMKVLSDSENVKFLRKFGYNNLLNLEDYLMKLNIRFKSSCPHEIGLFIGIPLKDISGFIENEGNGYIESGYWKVYSNPVEARRIFENCDSAKLVAARLILGWN